MNLLTPYITQQPPRAIAAGPESDLQETFSAFKLGRTQHSGRFAVMEEQDLQPQAQKPVIKNLEVLSIEALEAYIGELKAEIERVKAEISRKQSAKSAAESIFRK